MGVMTSTEFRKTYAGLSEPTTVTVNGHPIGVWTPTAWEPPRWDTTPIPLGASPQSKRDDLLRKINRSK